MANIDTLKIRFGYYFNDEYFTKVLGGGSAVWNILDNLGDIIAEHKGNTNNYYIDPTTNVHDSAIIKNSVLLGNCFVGEFVTIRDSIIGPGCIIGHCSEVARSAIMHNSVVAHFCFVGDSVVGSEVLIAGGVRTANRRLDKQEIKICIDDETIATGKLSLGMIVGDNTQIGGGVHPNPGTLIGQEVLIMPGIEVRGFVPSFSYVKTRQDYEIIPRNDIGNL